MLIVSNVIIGLLVGVVLFVIFTALNIYTFTRHFITTLFLTGIFFNLFLKMPFTAIGTAYETREKIVRKARAKGLPEENVAYLNRQLSSKVRIFFFLIKSGNLSYSGLMEHLNEWYYKKPFKVHVRIHIKELKSSKISYQHRYLDAVKSEIYAHS